jgi:hypothetical protein
MNGGAIRAILMGKTNVAINNLSKMPNPTLATSKKRAREEIAHRLVGRFSDQSATIVEAQLRQ